MITVPVWLIVIGGFASSGGHPPTVIHHMFTDKESCLVIKNQMSLNSDYTEHGYKPRVSCVRVNVLVTK